MLQLFKKLWTGSPWFMLTTILMLLAFAGSVAGLFLDSRLITGAPAWLKPAKFGISSGIFSASMAWLFQYLTALPRMKRALEIVLSFVLVLEVGIIDAQAARGIASHFNIGTPLDGILFGIMGAGIAVLWVCMLWVAILLFLQSFAEAAFGWALRLGMAITVIGAGAGGMMLGPNHQQSAHIRRHQPPAAIGGHTVGAPDGGAGLPGLDWSVQHGDLRIPHFLGLHALQIIPFCAWLLWRRRGSLAVRAVFVTAGSYLALIGLLTWQALRGQSIAEPDSQTLIAFAAWLTVTLGALAWAQRSRSERAAFAAQSIA